MTMMMRYSDTFVQYYLCVRCTRVCWGDAWLLDRRGKHFCIRWCP